MRKAFQVAVVIAGLSIAAGTHAAEPRLGTIESRSQAGEPVSARIPLRDIETDQLDEFEVELAPSRVFERAGIQRQDELSLLSFEIVTEGEDAPYIEVSSDEPVDLPLLDFLVRISWPQGDLTREYTLLLEEPTTVAEARERRERAEREEEQRQAEAELESAEEEAERDARGRSAYGPVEEGDTLWSIAEQHRPDDSVTVAQTMLAIQRLNPHAFADDNVNDLLSGWWLRLPDEEEIKQLSAAEAQSIYEDHLAAWVPPAERRAAAEEWDPQAPIPEIDEPVPDVAEREARLRVVAMDDKGTDEVLALLDADLEPSEANLSRLQGAVAAMREERESLRAERDNLQDRVRDLGERVEALERLLDLSMDDILPPPQEPTPRAPIPEVGMLEEELPRPEPAPEPEPTPEPEPEPEVAEEERGEAPWWASMLADVEELDVAPEDITAAHLWEEDTLRQRALIALGLTLVAISAITGLIAYRRRKQMQTRQSPRKRFDPADFGLSDEQEQSYSRRDPLDLAEDYIADDEFNNARQILERGIHREPHRADLRLKLLDVLANLNERDAFMDQAQELYDRTRSDSDPVWQTALNIGRRFAPDSPLFGGLAAGAATAAAAADGDPYGARDNDLAGEGEDDLDSKPDLEALDLGFDDEDEGQQSAGADDDFDRRLDEAFGGEDDQEPEPAMQQDPEQSAAAQDAADDLFGQGEDDADSGYDELEEMDIDGLLSEEGFDDESEPDQQPAAGDAEAEPADQGAADGESGDDFDELLGATEQQAESEQTEQAADSDADTEESSADEEDELPDDDELSLGPGEGDQSDTMLDLARAYIDLGDEASAREMLEEVIEKGTESQRESAREILSELGS
ncbi:probable type IV pilus assembly FimV-related transmembrane protein [Halorhodospira halochloris]|uniref:Probable type IV pilus assembly FimV-related transmembrane protein n=1 Tax=Halorhodospira halochloris TaxID=1052 RepID=A0A110B731_HALHR|nr:FimV/HubP family polar landmark protein [Halorhodospira halochloris]MBK1652314.1 hypothetical protein [Halorhodospira halochloris]BAU57718.1 probable type IV pilus assembly FimV-related transmembrane protein [Halorhodospira halochloris]